MADNRIKTNNPLSTATNGRTNSSAANNLLNSIQANESQGRISSRVTEIGQKATRYRSIGAGSAKRDTEPNQAPRMTRSIDQTRNKRTGLRAQYINHSQQNKRLSRDGLLMMLVDKDGNNKIDLEEVLLYVLKLKSQNKAIPTSLYKLHPHFKDVVETLDIADTNRDLSIQNTEAVNALLKSRAGLIKEQGVNKDVVNFVINYLNENNIEDINTALELIDTNPDINAEISDLEVLGALLASRRGELDVEDPHIDMVLRSNANYSQLLSLISSMSIDFNGNVTDEQAFDILLALRGDDVGEAIIQQALFLSTNENLLKLENSVALFDNQKDGEISNEEFIEVLMQSRRNPDLEVEHQLAINILKNKDPYADIFAVIEALDSTKDGRLTDDEVIDFTLASLNGSINLDTNLVEQIIHGNHNVDLIRNLITQVDTEADTSGEISNEEFLTATTQLLTDRVIAEESRELISKIISHNPNSAAILEALDLLDKDNDNAISNNEALAGIIASYKGEVPDSEFYDMVLNLNAQKAELQALVDLINPSQDGNPSLDDSFNFILDFKDGTLTQSEELIRSVIAQFPEAQDILETYELMETGTDGIDLREYTTALIAINSGIVSNPGAAVLAKFTEHVEHADIVNEGIAALDTITVDGLVSAEEFLTNFNQLFVRDDNTVDMNKLNIFLSVSDIIYPDSAALNQFIQEVDTRTETPVNIISDTEVIDALFNLNNNSIIDPGPEIVNAVLSRNPNKVIISNLVIKIDADQDGEVNNIELTKNLLKFRRNEFTEDPALIQYILDHKNDQYSEVNSLISSFDKDEDGIIQDLELMAELFANRNGVYPGLSAEESAAIITELKATNPNSEAISNIVERLDLDKSGTVDYNELVAAYLAINSGNQSDFRDGLKQALPGSDGTALGQKALDAEQLIKIVDSDNHDGQISDLEIAGLLLSDKAVNTLASYDPALIEAIYASNGNKTRVEEIVNLIDTSGDGVIGRSEVITAIMTQRSNSDYFGTDLPLALAILERHNSESNQIQTIIDNIDEDDTGVISTQEAMNVLVAEALGNITGIDAEISNQVIDQGPETSAVRAAFNNYGIDFNSSNLAEELFSLWVEIQQGITTVEYFDELVQALGMTNDFGALTTQFQEIDTDDDNVIQPAEYGQLMVDIITGIKPAADYQLLVNILSNDPNLAPIKTILDSFNLDANNSLNDQNIVEGLRTIRENGDLSIMDQSFIQTILERNPNSEGILRLLDLTDPSKTNSMTQDSVEQLWLDLIAEKKKSPPNLAFDFNNDGKVDDKDKETIRHFHSFIGSSVHGFYIRH